MSGSMGGDLPIAALLFERNGEMSLVILDKTDPDEASSVRLVSQFFQYALSREDWMGEYAKVLLPDPPPNDKKTYLRLIKSDKRDIN